ncbi:MAG: DegT/DnrJ/EryC1/StrS family aminotransferase, partial [Rhodopirellula sp. JB044]|uniref:DegT/DnrJ/EryC1/StrS family aminotransferase n=1 Tax=Rhodopirellula sp. JB044 TaxID=3342844 RepID=UPI00370C303B
MSGEVPSQLSLDDLGWPVWPPNDPAVFQSLQRTWDAGEWGSYHTELHSRCAEQFANLCRVNDRWATDDASPWHRYADRIQRDVNVRLCSSGSAAVELSLRGVGVKPGDEVIVAAYDYPGNFRTIELLGGKPVLVDVRANGVTIDPASLEQIQSDSVRAVIVSHLYGELADVLSIRKICDERGWHLIEDACQVPGAGWRSNTGNGSDSPEGSQETDAGFVPVGALADVVAYSFGGSKLLSAGNGGAVVTRDPRVAARLKS